jgi:uncharacterized protein YlxP (DUF503 family)
MRGLILMVCLANGFFGHSQTDLKPVVGVERFTSEVDSKYADAVAEKVAQVVTNTKRFIMVERISKDKIHAEMEFQKSEAFLDSKTAKQGVALAAQFLINGHILKMSIYKMKNADGSINGFKASTAFTLKVNNVELGTATEAEDFQTSVSPLMLSPESAVNEALKSIEQALNTYFTKTFPLITKIQKVLTIKKESAATVLIVGGRSFGFKEGDKLLVESSELLDGKPYVSQIGEVKIAKIAGEDFSECTVLEGGKEMLKRFNATEVLTCKLIVK